MLDLLESLDGVDVAALSRAKEQDELLDVRRTAALLGQTPTQIRAWAKEGLLPADQLGTAFYFRARRLWDFLWDVAAELGRQAKNSTNDPEREKFTKAFGPRGGIWHDAGLSFQQAQERWREIHQEETEEKRVNCGLGGLAALAVQNAQSPAGKRRKG